jgi:hypothetical protein
MGLRNVVNLEFIKVILKKEKKHYQGLETCRLEPHSSLLDKKNIPRASPLRSGTSGGGGGGGRTSSLLPYT